MEQTKSNSPALINPFCVNPAPVQQPALDNVFVHRITGTEVDRETLSVKPVYEDVDLVAEIQACKDLAGLDYMKSQLAAGLASPEDFYDNGQSGFDTTVIPETVHEAAKKADAASADIAEIAKAIGIDGDEPLTAAQFEKALTAAVKARVDATLAAQNAASTSGGDQQ